MKILQIFGAVVAVHLLAFIFIFASPGCQSGPRNVPTPDATVPSGVTTTSAAFDNSLATPQPVDLGTSSIAYSPASPSGHPVPTRPGSPNAAVLTPVKATEDVTSVSTYTVGKGESLWSIAKKNHLTVAELAKANNLGTGATMQPGKKLIIPGKVITAAPKDVATAPSTVKAGAAAGDTAKTTPATRPSGEAVTHTVLPGESLGVIARKFQVTTGELAAANSITDPSKVRAGQVLVIPGFKAVGSKSTTSVVKPAASSTAKSAPATASAAPADSPATATVKTPHFEIAPPPPGQDLDSGLKDGGTQVPTIKVEPKADQPPQK